VPAKDTTKATDCEQHTELWTAESGRDPWHGNQCGDLKGKRRRGGCWTHYNTMRPSKERTKKQNTSLPHIRIESTKHELECRQLRLHTWISSRSYLGLAHRASEVSKPHGKLHEPSKTSMTRFPKPTTIGREAEDQTDYNNGIREDCQRQRRDWFDKHHHHPIHEQYWCLGYDWPQETICISQQWHNSRTYQKGSRSMTITFAGTTTSKEARTPIGRRLLLRDTRTEGQGLNNSITGCQALLETNIPASVSSEAKYLQHFYEWHIC
jgi:hypothetical protein